ncbi:MULTISPECIES: hypothetical protein [unclassified Streptomyces]|uniref:hypothetical protein n=1 Tax=unclassified Streptomyces TaxID=2593676 RepID=UPI0029675F09|nr:hypothetical protein [Streptomyces sp. SJL17-1]
MTQGTALTTPSTLNPSDRHALLLRRLEVFLVESEAILAAWDAYSDKNTDADGQPYDEVSYGWRMVQRDSETWRAFQEIRYSARELLATAAVQLQHTSAGDIGPRWAWQLAELARALEKLEALQNEHAKVREARRTSPPVSQEKFVDSLAERNEEAWDGLDTWAIQGRVLLDIHAVALKAPARILRTAPTPTAAAAARRLAGKRR